MNQGRPRTHYRSQGSRGIPGRGSSGGRSLVVIGPPERERRRCRIDSSPRSSAVSYPPTETQSTPDRQGSPGRTAGRGRRLTTSHRENQTHAYIGSLRRGCCLCREERLPGQSTQVAGIIEHAFANLRIPAAWGAVTKPSHSWSLRLWVDYGSYTPRAWNLPATAGRP
jgi:hypothetical protein